ncbi:MULTISPECIES: PA2779 family protein [Marinobacter]|uniref:PA2779 family protein n=1 Tax=Marinobacter TaxID=2742 RepID=UPI001E3CFE0D|nr:PA2779 family protein [Marinobacter sp. CA1]MCG8519367.1 PA2779 family protein [Pseudomonadales bacterium]MCK7568130.1 PA2779 family protein [Marinobacter xestospongiae]
MIATRTIRQLAPLLCLALLASMLTVPAQAAIVGTGELIQQQHQTQSRASLSQALSQDDVRQSLKALGVSEDQVQQRIDRLTPAELASFNQQLNEAPAGEGVVGVIVLFVLVFIITDMLCATDLFPFVNCIR